MPEFTLELLHAADQEAGIPALDDAPRFSAVLNALRNQDLGNDGQPDNTLVLSSGDAIIPGLFFSASEQTLGGAGRADILIQNELGFQAIALGNHEFDLGTGLLADLIGGATDDPTTPEDESFVGAQFPYLSANLDFSTDANLAPFVGNDAAAPQTNSLAASTVIDVNGELIGVVGATTPTIDRISSPDDVTISPVPFDGDPTPAQLDALAAEIQADVDALLAANTSVNKVVVLAHMQQIAIEESLAARLRNVDIIVAGGSNTRLFDSNDRPRAGDSNQGEYPTFINDADGNPVAVVNTDGNYKYVGRLVVDFDENGIIDPTSYDAAVSGAYATDAQGVADLNAEGLVDPEIQAIVDDLRTVIEAQESNVFGVSNVYLNGVRGSVRTEETNLGNLTADANLAIAREITGDDTILVSIKNGGGIRDDIGREIVPAGGTGEPELLPNEEIPGVKPEGGISQTDIANSLRFNNGLTVLDITRAGLVAVLEHSIAASSLDDSNTQGRFPQVSGIEFSFDLTLPADDRIQSAAIKDENGNIIDVLVEGGELAGDPEETIRIVTLGFLAGGGDGFPFQDFGSNFQDLDQDDAAPRTGDATFAPDGTEQDALAEYLFDNFLTTAFDEGDTGRESDERLQNLAFRPDDVLETDGPATGVFTSFVIEQVVEVTSLTNADTISLQLDQLTIESVSELLVFTTDAAGGNRTQISSVVLLESGELGGGYTPALTINSTEITVGSFLQFELVVNGVSTIATPSTDANGALILDFGDGNQVVATAADETATTNLLINDAAAIDLSGQPGTLAVEFSVFREAAFNNTVGLYTTDSADGGIVDALTGNTLLPGDAGYEEAALANRLDVSLTGENNQVTSFSASIEGGGFLGLFLIADGSDPAASEVYFSHAGQNSNGDDHVRQLGSNTFGFEDLAGLGDADYNDVVVVFDLV